MHTVSFDDFTFRLRHIVNPPSMDLESNSEKALPPSDRIGTNNGSRLPSISALPFSRVNEKNILRSSEIETLILGCASVLIDKLKLMLRGNFVEIRLKIMLVTFTTLSSS
jgi:hypothetical protein